MRPTSLPSGANTLGGLLLLAVLSAQTAVASDPVTVTLDEDHNRLVVTKKSAGGLSHRTELQPTADVLDGVCSGRMNGEHHAFAFTDTGYLAHFMVDPTDASLHAVRKLQGAVDIKSCVLDTEKQVLFVLEDGIGLWGFEASPESSGGRRLLSDFSRGELPKDAEALELKDGTVYAEGQSVTLPPIPAPKRAIYPEVNASAETVPVATRGDAADDPVIWHNPSDPEASLILGADKRFGLRVYNLAGYEVARFPTGRINNVDLRELPDHPAIAALVAGSNRSRQSISFFAINADGDITELKDSELPTGLDDPYGLCLWRSKDELRVVVNDKDGRFRTWQLHVEGGEVRAKRIGTFRAEDQPEGCVGDDAHQRLFYGVEEVGLKQITADGEATFIDHVDEPRLVADVEGMSIYLKDDGGYLVVSSQGDDSFAVYDRLPPHTYRGSVRISADLTAGIDGVSETDGLDVHSGYFGPEYPEGILVVQDGHNVLPGANQNFKIIDWRRVASALELD